MLSDTENQFLWKYRD